MTFTIGNAQTGNKALTNVSFTDALPAGLEVVTPAATPANYGTTGAGCTGVTFAPTAGATTLNYAATNVAAGATCTAYVDVKATKAGQFDNVSGYITSAESGENKSANGYGTASLVAIAPPVLAKSFSPTSIVTGSTSTMSFTITNPNLSNALSGIGFTDSGAGWPAGLTVATSGPTSTCGGTLSTTSPNSLTFSGGTLAANTSCTFSVTVTGTTAGTKTNTTSAVTSTQGGPGNTASATLGGDGSDVPDRFEQTDFHRQHKLVQICRANPYSKYLVQVHGFQRWRNNSQQYCRH